MATHDGHRERLRERVRAQGLDSFSELNTLELLLCYAIPREDTNPIAHRLLERFGSLSGVMDASAQELEKVEGVGPNASLLLRLIPQFGRKYLISRTAMNTVLTSADKAGDYLMPFFYGLTREAVYLLCLDAKLKVLCCRQVGDGGLAAASVSMREVMQMVLDNNTAFAILAHNHPGGFAVPSREDVDSTISLQQLLRTVDVELLDHIIVADDDFVSLKQSKMMK